MIEHSFIHLPGISPAREQSIWEEGIHTWDALDAKVNLLFGQSRSQKIHIALEESREALAAKELSYFHKRFKGADLWRLVPNFLECQSHNIAYLDIETTGLGFPPHCHSTSIAVLYGRELFIEHEPERKAKLLREIDAKACLLVTFNGSTFDLPFLRKEFNLTLLQPHLDLRFWFKRLGFAGGLKKIQTMLPGVHQRESMDIDGYDAVRLWQLHQRGVPRALESLMAYNAEDTVVLESMVFAGLELEASRNKLLSFTPPLMRPTAPKIVHQVCPKVYARLRS